MAICMRDRSYVNHYNTFFERVLFRFNYWKETIQLASKVFEIDNASVEKVISKIDSMEEEVLHIALFYL